MLAKVEAIDYSIQKGREFTSLLKQILECVNKSLNGKINHELLKKRILYFKDLQSILNNVKDVTIKETGKQISFTQLIDWFLTAGQSVEDLFSNNFDVEFYNVFIGLLLSCDYNVKETFQKALSYFKDFINSNETGYSILMNIK